MPDKSYLRQMQALPISAKVRMSQQRTREWYEHFDGDVYISFSGGKDSTVLAHIVHEIYPKIPLVFVNTGLEFPEIQSFAKKMGAEFIRPKMSFSEVISTYGYPIISKENAEAIAAARKIRNGNKFAHTDQKRKELTNSRMPKDKEEPINIPKQRGRQMSEEETMWRDWRRKSLQGIGMFSKEVKSIYNKQKWLPMCRDTQFKISHYCCNVMKKNPMNCYQHKHKAYPILGTLADESKLREQAWIKHGCNAYDCKKQTSQPMSFWLEQDVLKYIHDEGLEISSVYGNVVAVDDDGYEYEPIPGMDCKYQCTGCQRTGCVFCGFGVHLEKGETRFQRLAKTHPKQYEYCMGGGQWVDNPKYDPVAPKMDGTWQNWNPKKIWVPSKEGLGMKKVFDDCNAIYGKDFIRYE